MSSPPQPGGFLHTGILSPPASSVHSSNLSAPLPSMRRHPLKVGGSKESSFIRHVDQGITHINRRYAKRKSRDTVLSDVKGYASFREAAKDIECLVDVVWVSGTPNLQVPYLLSLALLVVDFLPGFPPSPKSAFRLLDKLDVAFASLLQGRDLETAETLPGFETGWRVSDTEKVRIKGIVERTRVCVVDVMSGGDPESEEEDEERDENKMALDSLNEDGDEEDVIEINPWEMRIAKVYDRTIVELGDTIGGEPIGIVTDG